MSTYQGKSITHVSMRMQVHTLAKPCERSAGTPVARSAPSAAELMKPKNTKKPESTSVTPTVWSKSVCASTSCHLGVVGFAKYGRREILSTCVDSVAGTPIIVRVVVRFALKDLKMIYLQLSCYKYVKSNTISASFEEFFQYSQCRTNSA